MNKHFNLISWLLFAIFLFSILIYNSFSYLDPDLGWHLQIGKEIWEQKQVPDLEIHDYTLLNQHWVDHEWLINLISYLTFEEFGYLALNLLFIVLTFVVFLLIFQQAKNYHPNASYIYYITIAATLVLGIQGMRPHLGVRMQTITLLGLLLLLILIQTYEKKRYFLLPAMLTPLLYFWANLHAGFLIGLFISALYVFIKILENILSESKFFQFLNLQNKLSVREIANFSLFYLLALSTTLITPYGLKLYSFLKDYFTNTYYFSHIQEWLPVWTWPINYFQLLFHGFLAMVLIILAIKTIKKVGKAEERLTLWNFSLACLFLLLSFKSRRHFPLFVIASMPIILQFARYEIETLLPKPKSINPITAFFLFSTLVLASLLLLLSTNFTNHPFTNSTFCQDYPCGAVKYMEEKKLLDLKIFNHYGYGGYLIWVWPQKQLFIDGRLPQYEYGEHTILEEYDTANDNPKTFLQKHEIELVLLEKSQSLKYTWLDKHIFGLKQPEKNPNQGLVPFLNQSPDWQLEYDDNISLIYVKKDYGTR